MATAAVNGKRVRETPPYNSDADRNVRLTCDLDLDILECPICTESLSPPVFQCPNGHPICSSCHVKVSTCPSCSKPIGATRNLLAEKILESLQVRCEHAAHGCKIMLQYSTREEHIKKLCAYRPCPCPVPGCKHEGLKQTLAQHLDCDHQVKTFTLRLNTASGFRKVCLNIRESRFVLLKCDEKVRLLLHIEPIETFGYLFYCTTFEDYAIKYDLQVRYESERELCTTMLKASAEDILLIENRKRDALLFYTGGGFPTVSVTLYLHNDVQV